MMKRLLFVVVVFFLVTSCGHTYYIVRHAEKAQSSTGNTMQTTNDPLLSREGEARAEALKEFLKDKQIRYILSTNTKRTLLTAAPAATYFHLTPEIYASVDRPFITRLQSLKGNALVVAHSNTIDDLVNQLSGRSFVKQDLPDSTYDNLYIIKGTGKKMNVRVIKYGVPSR